LDTNDGECGDPLAIADACTTTVVMADILTCNASCVGSATDVCAVSTCEIKCSNEALSGDCSNAFAAACTANQQSFLLPNCSNSCNIGRSGWDGPPVSAGAVVGIAFAVCIVAIVVTAAVAFAVTPRLRARYAQAQNAEDTSRVGKMTRAFDKAKDQAAEQIVLKKAVLTARMGKVHDPVNRHAVPSTEEQEKQQKKKTKKKTTQSSSSSSSSTSSSTSNSGAQKKSNRHFAALFLF
jgi:hypothetical protein